MSATSRKNNATQEFAGCLFSEIAAIAESLREVLAQAIQESAADGPGAELTAAARVMVDQMGWLADRGASMFGASMSLGNANDWMLSPTSLLALARCGAEGVDLNGQGDAA